MFYITHLRTGAIMLTNRVIIDKNFPSFINQWGHRSSIHWYMGHSPCVYFRLFTLSQAKGETAFFANQLGVRFLPFSNYRTPTSHQSVHGNLIYLNIHSPSKFEESQRNWRFYSLHNNVARWSLTNGTFIVDPVIFLRAKIPNGIFHYELHVW